MQDWEHWETHLQAVVEVGLRTLKILVIKEKYTW